MIIACADFSLESVPSVESFWERVDRLIEKAHQNKANAILFPEYFTVSLGLHVHPAGEFCQRLKNFAKDTKMFCEQMQKRADQFDIAIIAGSTPYLDQENLLNRCFIFRPGQNLLFQDKVHMTRFESEEWQVIGGAEKFLTFQWLGRTCAVAICYDIEFPATSRQLIQSGVDVVFVPSCTDTEHGYWRVRHCAEARAVEGQMFALMASIVGGDPKYPEIDRHFGQSVVLTPCDGRFPPNGELAKTKGQREELLVARLDFDQLDQIRQDGSVFNARDNRTTK